MTKSTRRSVVLLVSLAGLLTWLAASGCAPGLASQPPASPTPQDMVADDPSIGPADAPVVMQEYADYVCPHCAVWEQQGVRQKLIDKYGDKLRFVRHDYAVLSPQSRPAALAARCAGDQGQYWQYHDKLYARYPALDVSDLKQLAADMELDTATFNTCLDNQDHFEQVAGGLKDGIDHHFFATPSFLVNAQRVIGGQSFEFFSQIIDEQLAAPK